MCASREWWVLIRIFENPVILLDNMVYAGVCKNASALSISIQMCILHIFITYGIIIKFYNYYRHVNIQIDKVYYVWNIEMH